MKKWFAVLLSTALMIALAAGFQMTAFADEAEASPEVGSSFINEDGQFVYTFMSAMGVENIMYCSIDEDGILAPVDIIAPDMNDMSVIGFFTEEDLTATLADAQAAYDGTAAPEENGAAAEPAEVTFDFENWKSIVTYDVLDYPVVFELLPEGYNTYENEHAGQILRLHYTTDAYDDGQTYEKYCTVYLPYGYDAADTETRYNVIYFQHGNGGTPNELWDHDIDAARPMNLFNNMFDEEHQVMEPCIIICPTYYFELDEESWMTDPDAPAGDGRFGNTQDAYYKEIIEDLIPQVESQFNVYCEDFSPEGIIASRNHRAWAGYSRGSICTWKLFHEDLPYFKYWMPMSAAITLGDGEPGEDAETAYQYLKEAVEQNPEYDFFIYATTGGESDNIGNMKEQMKYLVNHDDSFLSYGLDPERNNFFFSCSEFTHYDSFIPYSIADAATILFKF